MCEAAVDWLARVEPGRSVDVTSRMCAAFGRRGGLRADRDGARLAAERDIGDDRASAVSLGELLSRDHDRRLAAAGVTAAFGDRRATRTMVALTARIDRRPTHCSGSPMPSPQ
jgi:hypothetical protein